MKDAVKPKPSFDANDGEFWMCYRDFLKLGSSKMLKAWKVTQVTQIRLSPSWGKSWVPHELPRKPSANREVLMSHHFQYHVHCLALLPWTQPEHA